MATGRVPTTANSPLTAKGDLFGYSTTQARVPVGNDGETLVADSSASTGLRWQGNFAAGKNKVINGDMSIWQRGTSYNVPTGLTYGAADRWIYYHAGSTAGTNVVTRETFTPGSAPVAGYEGQYYQRWTATTLGTSQSVIDFWQRIEDVRTLAGQTVTFSFWFKSSISANMTVIAKQFFGTGGSADVDTNFTSVTPATASSNWVRYVGTMTLPSISGKTITSDSNLRILVRFNNPTAGATFDLWGVQLEAGNTATAFQTATGTLAGELLACKRYYQKILENGGALTTSAYYNSSYVFCSYKFEVEMRTAPTLSIATGTNYYYNAANGALDYLNSLTISNAKTYSCGFYNSTEAAGTAGHGGVLGSDNANGSMALSAEL